jgi:hypothetical protein
VTGELPADHIDEHDGGLHHLTHRSTAHGG